MLTARDCSKCEFEEVNYLSGNYNNITKQGNIGDTRKHNCGKKCSLPNENNIKDHV